MEISGKIIGAVSIVVIVITLLALTPTVVDQVQTILTNSQVNGTNEWNFTGYQGAQALLGLVPFIWVASILIAGAVGMFELAKKR